MIKFNGESEAAAKMVEAMKTNDDAQIKKAWEEMHQSIVNKVKADFEELKDTNDAAVLAQRGYRQLTVKEKDFYQKLSEVAKSGNPKQAFVTILGSDNEDDIMPSTIIEDVYKDLAEEYPILGAVNFRYVQYLTKWILNDHTKQAAAWGAITAEVVTAITSAFKVIDIKQSKLSAYAVIEKGMLDLGPTFLDAYIRECLKQAIAYGLEDAIVNGSGIDKPIGLIRNLSSYDTSTGYAAKSATAVTELTAETYGGLLATLAETEEGKPRKFARVAIAVNQQTYLTKVMPATKVQGVDGKYSSFLDSIFPTDIILCNSVADNKAVLFIPEEYYLFMGGDKNGIIEYSDDFHFVEDERYFKIKQYGTGRCFDNTCAVYLDVANLDAAFVNVKNTPVV